MKKIFPIILLTLYLLETMALGVDPSSRSTWLAESITAWIPLACLIVLYVRKIRFSNTAYLCMALWFFLHTIGGHYTFAEVPFDWITNTFHFSRNNFDRICHFMVGSFAYVLLEVSERYRLVRIFGLSVFLTIMTIFGFAAIFELIEWIYAECSSPEDGIAFLGSQGDIWDAQKDMLADGLGAICFSALYACIRYFCRHNEENKS